MTILSRNRLTACGLLLPLVWALAPVLADPQPTVIFDMDTVAHQPAEVVGKDKIKAPAGTAELVEGKIGKAVRFSFTQEVSGAFMTGRVRATPDWDKSDGFSFWVKGDGSDSFGGIELIDRDDFALRYGYCFPIDSREWKKITVPWRDVVPELANPLVDAGKGYAPSHFGNLFFGKWFYWATFPQHSYAIDQVVLEPKLDPAPEITIPAGDPLARVRGKLHDHKPITFVTMGDSLSDKHHWANREILWSELLAKDLKAKHGGEATLVNPAIGGTTLSQNVILMPRWGKQAPSPDLVTIWFGGNDFDTKVTGPRFKEYLQLAVDRIRRQTNGSADILIMTTAPGHARWETYADFEQAAKEVAKEKNTGLLDIAAEFRKAGTADEALKRTYWAWDKVHLGAKGHELTKDCVLAALAGEK